MKSFSQLLKDLQVGRQLVMTYNHLAQSSERLAKMLNVPRYITKKQSNGVSLNEEKDGTKGSSFLQLDRASLVEYDGETIKIYEEGIRDLTEEEENILKNLPSKRAENKEAVYRDMMTDGNSMYWSDRYFTAQNNAEWYWTESRGKYYLRGEHKMQDASIKGTLSLEYKLI